MRYQDVVLADGPVGYWPLNETGGTTAYALGSTVVNGTYNGTITLGAVPFPAGGRAPYWGGSDATTTNVSIADNAAWSAHAGASGVQTFEFWFRPDPTNFYASGETGRFFLFGKTNPYEQYCYTNNGTLLTGIGQSGGTFVASIETTGTVRESAWNHTVFVFNNAGDSAALWLNGRRVGETTSFTGTSSDTASTLYVGGKSDAAGRFYRGSIAHVAIYSKTLDANRIMAHYRAGLARPTRLPFRTRAA